MSNGKSWIEQRVFRKARCAYLRLQCVRNAIVKNLKVIKVESYGANCNLQMFFNQNREAYVCICYS